MEINNSKKYIWVIWVAGYGGFFFEGLPSEAEKRRIQKANQEGGIGRKRIADETEITTNKIDQCMNHPNYDTDIKYACKCYKCVSEDKPKEEIPTQNIQKCVNDLIVSNAVKIERHGRPFKSRRMNMKNLNNLWMIQIDKKLIGIFIDQ